MGRLRGSLPRFFRRAPGLILLAAIFLLTLHAASRRWAEYEYEMQSPTDDPADANQETEFAYTRLRYTSYNDRFRYRAWGIDANKSDRLFIKGLRRLTRVDGRSVEQIVDTQNDEMFNWPWIYVVSGGDWVINEEEGARLRRYFDRGGFMIVDDFHGEPEWETFMYGLEMMFPDRVPVELDDSAEIFHVFYDLTDRTQVPGYQIVTQGIMYERGGVTPHWRAVLDEEGRVQIGLFFNHDLGDAWEFADDPAYPEQFASMAYRMGVNYVIYPMTH